jgi:prophage regulatory protein
MVHSMDLPAYLLRAEQVAQRIGLSRRTLFKMVKDGQFAPPIRLGARTVRWASSDVDGWIAARLAERDQRAA